MAWEYLNQETDYRILPIAGYLYNKITNKTILDLDCLRARLIHYLPATYKKYIGNDLIDAFPRHLPKTEFYNIPDEDIINALSEVDILVVLGYGGNPKENSLESYTIHETIIKIIYKFEPEYIILEACSEPKYSDGIRSLSKQDNYVKDFHFRVDNNIEDINNSKTERYLFQREIICLRRQNKFTNTI